MKRNGTGPNCVYILFFCLERDALILCSFLEMNAVFSTQCLPYAPANDSLLFIMDGIICFLSLKKRAPGAPRRKKARGAHGCA